jgi:CRISPR-associated protein Cas1
MYPFNKIDWFKLSVTFRSRKTSDIMKSHPFSVIEAIIKAVNAKTFSEMPQKPPKPIFHITDQKHTFRLSPDLIFNVDVFFFQMNFEEVGKWHQFFSLYLSKNENTKTLSLVETRDPELRNYDILKDELKPFPEQGEVCLEFLTPLFFKTKPNKVRTHLDTSGFIKGFERRFSRLFGINFTYKKQNDDFFIIPAYWNYTEIKHSSRSQPRATQYVNGCVGDLYLKGTLKNFIPYLAVGSEIHAGTKLSNSQGYFKLHQQSKPYFSVKFPGETEMQTAVRDVIERYDQALESLSQKEMFPFDEKKFAAKFCKEISRQEYTPSPNTSFKIKSGQSARLVEQLNFKDLIVSQYLLRLISPVFDKLFEKESIGFRKGYSRNNARQMIHSAIREGFSYVIESDIEDFFPSIDHKILFSLLDKYLPEQDKAVKSLIIDLITSGYILDGSFRQRLEGLPQGNPLSPILANLYLDSFDEYIKKNPNVRLVRYADDFIILCKDRKEAESLIESTDSYLSNLGLCLNRDKTSIHPIEEGFEFLGMTFSDKKGYIESTSTLNPFRKALYITEPYVYISVFGDAVRIKKEGKIIQTIPLRRIEEIIVLGKSTFSTSLLRKCIDYDIPLSITLDTGYHVTTIKPDSKKYFSISAEHTSRYNSLSGTEKLAIAKCIASVKIENYITLFRKNYKKGSHLFIKQLSEYKDRAETASSINELRGFEGITARKIYKKLNDLISDPAFHITKRQRSRPDMINSLMNFSSYLLFSRINATVRSLGLNPYLGFLHVPRNDYESLVSDIVELFRAQVDRFLIRIINLKTIQKKDFVKTRSGYYLRHHSAKKFLSHFENEMIRKNNTRSLSLKDNIYLQAVQFRDWVTQHKSLEFYRWDK